MAKDRFKMLLLDLDANCKRAVVIPLADWQAMEETYGGLLSLENDIYAGYSIVEVEDWQDEIKKIGKNAKRFFAHNPKENPDWDIIFEF